MSTMTTTTGSVECLVTHTSTEISVKSPSGRVLSISKDTLRSKSFPLFHLLTRHALKVEHPVTLTVSQMRLYAELCNFAPVPVVNVSAAKVAQQVATEAKLVELAKSTTCEATEARIANRVTGNGTSLTEQRINHLQEVVKQTDQQYSMLIYDIPSSLNDKCPNPSRTLWNYGFRLNLSCWVLPENGLNSGDVKELIALWKSYGLEVHIIPYAKEAMGMIRQIARDKLREEIARVSTSLIERIGAAKDRYDEAMREFDKRQTPATAADHERVEALRISNVKQTLAASATALNASINCARMFDETESVAELLKGLRAAIESERRSLAILLGNRTRG